MKAQLPNGKYLTFPDGTDFVVVQNKVREEIEKEREKEKEKLQKEKLVKETSVEIRALQKTMQDMTKEIATSLTMVSTTFNVIAERLGDTIKAVETLNKNVVNSVAKSALSVNSVADRVEEALATMSTPVRNLEASVNAMGTMLKDNAKASNTTLAALAKNFDNMGVACDELTKAIESVKVQHKMTKRAYRSPDGSWHMETV